MRKIKILGIAPYEGMIELLQNIANQRGDIELKTYIGDLDEGLAIAERYIMPDTDAIISRGDTAKKIREHFSVPVIEIPLSVYDVLRAIRLVQSFTNDFVIVGYEHITGCAKMLVELLKIDTKIYTVQSIAEAQHILENLAGAGKPTVLGGMSTTVYAQRLGLNAILITSGAESIQEAFNHARQICQSYVELRDRCDLMRAILQKHPQSAVYRSNGDLIYSAPSLPHPTLDSIFQKYIPVVLGGKTVSLTRQLDNIFYNFEGYEICIAGEALCLFIVTDKHVVKGLDTSAVQIFNQGDETPFNNYFGTTNAANNYIEIASELAHTKRTVLLLGEAGTNFDKTAYYIHIHSDLAQNSFVIINCENMSFLNAKFENLFVNHNKSILYNRYQTIYFAHMETLSPEQQEYVITYLMNNTLGNKYIFSADISLDQTAPLFTYLIKKLLCGVVRIPTIRELKNDIPGICTTCINILNNSLGKQVLGLSPEAQIFVRDYGWPGNDLQISRVLQSAMIRCQSHYITEAEIREALEAENMQVSESLMAGSNIDLTQTLDKINREIVSKVLDEEGGNQSKAARRLGISRSTVWRMVHS